MWGRRQRVDLADTPQMAAFFERLDHLNKEQLLSLHAAWQGASRAVHEDAWTSVRVVGARDGLTKEIERVRNKALRWASRGSNTIPYQLVDDSEWLQVKIDAGGAIVDAALAIALGDRLDEDAHYALIGPWLQATQAVE
ncbi:MAG: hypothetical protein ABSE58_12275 [Candidatus Limnocylindrales bacterium]|jgi:hypothetical protein